MNIERVREYCLSKKASTEKFPFDETTLTMQVMERIFVCISLDRPEWIIVKCDPDYALELRDEYPDLIQPASHFNKKYWNQIRIDSSLSDNLIIKLIDHSYDEVLKKLTKKNREVYNEM